MKYTMLSLLSLLSVICYGQDFAVIADKDGYVNVRSEANSSSHINDTLGNGRMVFCFDEGEKGNWINIDYSKGKKKTETISGWIYGDRCVKVASYQSIPIVTDAEKSVKLKKDSIEVVVTQKSFEKYKHTYKYVKGSESLVDLIDNKGFWGCDGELPKQEYNSIIVKVGQRGCQLPKIAIEDLYNPNLLYTKVFFDQAHDILYIQSMNSDGAGGYDVIWKIEKGAYKGRLVCNGF